MWAKGVAPFYFGHYVGGSIITAPTAGGASGSAVISKDGVIGVLVAVSRGFDSVTWMVPLPELRGFLVGGFGPA